MTSPTDVRRAGNGSGYGRTYLIDSGFASLAEPDPQRPSNRRLGAMVLMSLLLGLVLSQVAFFGSRLFDNQYRARAEVQYRGSSWTETQNVLAQSRSLAAPVAEQFGIPIKDFEEQLEAGLVPGTQIVRFDYIGPDRDLDRDIVAAMAAAYIAEISELPNEEAEVILTSQLEELNIELENSQADLRDLATDESEEARVEQQATQQLISSLRARINDLELRLLDAELRALDQEANGLPELVTAPYVFEDPVFPRPLLFGAIGFVVGCAIGAIYASLTWNRVAWTSLDRRSAQLRGS